MLQFDTNKNCSNTLINSSSKTLLAFKPRQVLLNTKSTMAASASKDENSTKITPLTPELKLNLHESILHYLNRNGFNKSHKRFQSEAQIQSDRWKNSSIHLEDIFCKYDACDAHSTKDTEKKPVLGVDKPFEKDNVCHEESAVKKKTKRGTVQSNNGATIDQSEVVDEKVVKFDKEIAYEVVTKSKKKKTKYDLEPSATTEIESVKENPKKEKKIKKNRSSSDSAVKFEEVNTVETDTKDEPISKKEKTSSKKRKRSLSDDRENDNGCLSTEKTTIEELKPQKTETFEEGKTKKEETSNEKHDGHANGKPDINGGEKHVAKKSTKKQRTVTDEPKTVNAFQRVKIDQVEFAHEKLQDNSYWAKDGADIGYGAKAQEVLGQVRGRDFRHEKTKKKRGSYRGGLIDLQSHSIKFNYSEEE
ncbi:uncharacterized protein [Rutidosis leptorrhynchoides]|uniref:uncharacterized protein n=1 Tax=Rutidosis leptorrhynchoides TaxID=125765 RepID=UPI003A98E11C